jgi:hypothetical protein
LRRLQDRENFRRAHKVSQLIMAWSIR